MKKNRILISFLVFVAAFLFLTACDRLDLTIYINGNINNTIEVNATFNDEGVTIPDGYTLVVDGEIDTSKLGKQRIVYYVYSSTGEMVKELHRYVTVVDSTKPSYEVKSNQIFYAGFLYELEDFISDYSDNYDCKEKIEVLNSDYVFNTSGLHDISITFKDSSNNISVYNKKINVVLDVAKLLNEVYKDQPGKVTTTETSMGSVYTNVRVDNDTSFSYFSTGSIHYLKTITTTLGNRASIQISSNYGEFSSANLSYHVSGEDEYSTGFTTIDATASSVYVDSFKSTINDLELDINQMLTELNTNINQVLVDFNSYMSEVLNLLIK